jgi:hypothetical protein
MYRYIYSCFHFITFFLGFELCAQFSLSPLLPLPTASSNGAISTGEINGDKFIYYWAGIDSTLIYSGINQFGYRYNLANNSWESLPPIPDDVGKIAFSASRIGDIIYLVGGYSVAANGAELSSNKVHRFSILQNAFIEDAADLPTPIDDHIQFVKNDSLIYVITGWSNIGNTGIVQVYNANNNSWQLANNLPATGGYNAFGAAGICIGDTVYYFGGASDGLNFPATNRLRKGFIQPENPFQIDWQSIVPNSNYKKYRAAGINLNNKPCFIGGSSISYNYNGISYANGASVSPSEDAFLLSDTGFTLIEILEFPMDIRDLAEINTNEWVIVGGLISGPSATSNVWKLTYNSPNILSEVEYNIVVFPNPARDNLHIRAAKTIKTVEFFQNGYSKLFAEMSAPSKMHDISVASLPSGIALIKVEFTDGTFNFKKLIIQH